MLTRKIEAEINFWLKNSNKALLIDGARQVGKTFIIKKVLKTNNVKNYCFNLIQTPEIVHLFEGISNVNSFINALSLILGKTIENGSVIFLDEIQECKEILTSIKFLVEQNDYRFILSGSLLGVELTNLRSAPVGYLETLHMYPLDFEEFALNQGVSKNIIDELRNNFTNLIPINDVIHQKMLEIFRNYLIVGGMPDAVNSYVENKSFKIIDNIHKNIIEQYKLDFSKYETSNKLKLIKIYDLMPSEINAPNKRFIFSNVEESGRFNKYENSFNWLIDAGVALPTYNVNEPRLPLRINMDNSSFKFFMSDVGLLTSCYGDASKIAILSNANNINCGSIYENFVAQELRCHGYDLYYYNNRRLGELDFVIEYNDSCLPIEVKSGKDYKRHCALNNVLSSNVYKVNKAIVLSNENIMSDGNIIYLPIYMTMFFTKHTLDDIKLKKVIL